MVNNGWWQREKAGIVYFDTFRFFFFFTCKLLTEAMLHTHVEMFEFEVLFEMQTILLFILSFSLLPAHNSWTV